jgi:hypothetical protein
MSINSVIDKFNKVFATLIIVGVFVLFVLAIFGVFELSAVLG